MTTPEQREHYARELIVECLIGKDTVNIGYLHELIEIARAARFAQELERFNIEEGARIALEQQVPSRIEHRDEDH